MNYNNDYAFIERTPFIEKNIKALYNKMMAKWLIHVYEIERL